MAYLLSKIKNCICLFFVLLAGSNALAQSNVNKQAERVFNQILSVYGSAKPAPDFIIRNTKSSQPAEYIAQPKPTIFLDAKVIEICQNFGKNNLNALSTIISHELAHYYSDHTFCSDYAVASRINNKSLAETLIKSSLSSLIEKETEADQKGLFYAAAAGHKPFDIFPQLVNELYKVYQLPDELPGYPSKQQRIIIAENAEKKAIELYTHFQIGLDALKNEKYDKAIQEFEIANSFIPFRENYNNLGISRTLKALSFKPRSRSAYMNPERFSYPLGIDKKSRLQQPNQIRSMNEDDYIIMQNLLKRAQKDFEKAISLDDSYINSYINLACVYDLLGNPMAAIGKIKELSKEQQNETDALRIVAIAYFNLEMYGKADEIWKKIGL